MDHVDQPGVQARQGILEACEGCQQDLGGAALYGRVQGFRIAVAAAFDREVPDPASGGKATFAGGIRSESK
jgi:hypothetical protein